MPLFSGTTSNFLSGAAAPAFCAASALVLSIARRRYATGRWLENVTDSNALAWVRRRNDDTLTLFGEPEKSPLYSKILAILDSKDKIPYVRQVGRHFYYNFWKDEKNVKGILRRTDIESYAKSEPEWETVLDVDELAKTEGENWVWKGYTVLDAGPDHIDDEDLCLVKLSRGGADAVVVREFDLVKKQFVENEAFALPEAKSRISYVTRDQVYVGTDFGKDGNDLTDSGYPRTVRLWQRGTPLESAPTVFEGHKSDVSAGAYSDHQRNEYTYHFKYASKTFYTTKYWLEIEHKGKIVAKHAHLDVPEDADVSVFGEELLVELRSAWLDYPAGSLLSFPAVDFHAHGSRKDAICLFKPTEKTSLNSYTCTKTCIVLALLDNVKSKLVVWNYKPQARWSELGTYPSGISGGVAQIDCWRVHRHASDDVWITTEGYTQPTSLSLIDVAKLPKQNSLPSIKSLPRMYDASNVIAEQKFATSEDGTKIPYFVVRPSTCAAGPLPTILYGYGGFEISLLPRYSSTRGVGWLEKGFIWVTANIRGGGEFGPKWHQAALRENRHKAFEDMAAVARALIDEGVTQPSMLAAMGGSNGGLLVGNMLVKYPHLFAAIVCQVPLLDMERYHLLLAGASWTAEYGCAEEDGVWNSYLKNNSPYHLVVPGQKYPNTLFYTSTRDDRVHPAHARKMVKRLRDNGHAETTHYFENMEGGHAGAADNKQSAKMWTLTYEFLLRTLASKKE